MRRSFDHVVRILATVNLTLQDGRAGAIVRRPTGRLAEYNKVYLQIVPEPRPARTTLIGCLGTVVKYEVDVVAYKGK